MHACPAVLERNFSTAGRLISGCRSRMDAAYNQIVLFLHGSLLSTPIEVPVLSEAQTLAAVPIQLSNPLIDSIKLLDGPEEKGQSGITEDEFAAEQEQL